MSVPGRPPKCFRCNEIGHIRGECPNTIGHIRGECPNTIAGVGRHAYLRSYSNAVTGANTTPLGECRCPVDRYESNSGDEASGPSDENQELSGGDEAPGLEPAIVNLWIPLRAPLMGAMTSQISPRAALVGNMWLLLRALRGCG